MNNPNLPDDCQSITDIRLPWNEPEYICIECDADISEDDGSYCDDCYKEKNNENDCY